MLQLRYHTSDGTHHLPWFTLRRIDAPGDNDLVQYEIADVNADGTWFLSNSDTPPSFTIEDTETGAEWTAENIEWEQHAFESTHGVVSRSEPTDPVTFIEGKLVDGRYTLFEKLGLDD